MPSTETRVEVAIGLVYQSGDLHAHLRDALRDSGASIVYETETVAFDRAALARSGAQVVIVNLDPDSDEQLEAIDDLLVDDAIKVVFNDGEVSSKLAGYDLARWARHLAAKIVGDAELLPPRPAGAEAVPVRSMPQHALTTTQMPKSLDAPSISDDSMRHATDAIADALASFDMHATKMEAKNSPGADDLSALLGDFGLTDPVGALPAAANPFADLGLSLDMGVDAKPAERSDATVAPAGDLAPTVEFANPFDGLDFESPVPAAERLPDERDPVLEGLEIGASELGAETPATSAESKTGDLLAFADLSFDEPPPATASVIGLDDLLAEHAQRAPAPAMLGQPNAETRTPPAAKAEPSQRLRELSLSADADYHVAASTPAPAPEVFVPNFDLSGLSLEPSEEEMKALLRHSDPYRDGGMSYEAVLDPSVRSKAALEPAPEPASLPPQKPAPVDETTPDFPFDLTFDETSSDSEVSAIGEAPASGLVPDFDIPDDLLSEFAALESVGPSAAASARKDAVLSRVWVLGASIGGPDAVREFLANIPASVQSCFVLAQHMGADFVDLMVAQLQKATPMPVAIAGSGMRAGHGQVLVAPIAERMLLDPSGEVKVVALDEASPYSPSIDRVLIDVADRFGADAGAIIFSGMAHDAIEGAMHLAKKGGSVWVQDPATCVVSSMIDGAMEAGVVSFIGTPVDLAAEFVRRFGKA